MKKLLFICDSPSLFKISTDTTYSLLLAASESNYEIYYSLPKDVFINKNIVSCNCIKLKFLQFSYSEPDITKPWYVEEEALLLNSQDFHAIFVRNDPPFNMEYYYLTQILDHAEKLGTKVINNSHALRNHNEKLTILNFPNFITDTMVTKDPHSINSFVAEHGDCVIKPLDMMAGRGVFKISKNEVNYGVILETITNYFTQTIMLQKFIPDVAQGDKRIFIVNGNVIDYCLHRIPQGTQIRGNIAAGGRGEVYPVSEQDHQMANVVAKWLQQNNILYAGLDVIGRYLTEVNITSPTGTRQIMTKTGINIPKIIIDSI
ncbi:MAG: glutathione synthase [Neisseriaceae bacterium]|jgi:glutathione synthase